MGTQNMILFLKNEYAARCARNPGYSMRAFALYLQVDHSLLAKIFRGERNISKNMSFKVGEKLGLTVENIAAMIEVPVPQMIQAPEVLAYA